MNVKKLLLLNLPYLLFVYLFDKLAQAFRLAPGADLSAKILSIGDGFTAAFSSLAPSLHPIDLLIGIAGAVILRVAVHMKGKNAKKYRHGMEYGCARWGTAADIAPYMDEDFFNNIPITQTERITMSSRPKQPKYARNKNIKKLQDFLYQKSGENKIFTGLLEAMSSNVTIITAIHNIKSNKGSKTADVDRKKMDRYLQMPKKEVVSLIQDNLNHYLPKSARRVYIKKSNGKERPRGIPTIVDRIVQEYMRIILEPICEAKFYPHSYGFRPYHAQKHAISDIVHTINLPAKPENKAVYALEGDIKGCFDNINHRILLQKLWKIGIHDKRVITIIRQMLKAGYVSTWILAALRNERFFSVSEVNETVREKLEKLNRTPFRKRDGCRRDAYLEEEKAFMKPLPASEYAPSAWTPNITVGYDYLVSDGRNRYSVPFDLIGEKVDIRLTGTMVEVFFLGNRVAVHPRAKTMQRDPIVNPEHMPAEHRKYLNYNAEDFQAWANGIGTSVSAVVKHFLTSGKEPEVGFKACASLTKLAEKYGKIRLEKACADALKLTASPSIRTISTILKNSKDNSSDHKPDEATEKFGITHGADYFGKGGERK